MKRDLQVIEREAAEWIDRRHRGFSATDEAEFARWLAVSPEHPATFAEVELTWIQMGRLSSSSLGAEFEAELAAFEARPRKKRGRVVWFSTAFGAAAALMIAYLAWWPPSPTHAPFAKSVVTEVGVVRTVQLPDGSVILLNTDSAVDVAYAATERRVRLRQGEAHFTVARSRERPFIVEASGIAVRAVGTAFNVHLRPESIEVLVTEGKVSIDESPRAVDAEAAASREPPAISGRMGLAFLEAGQKAVVPRAASIPESAPARPVLEPISLAPVDMDRALAWQNKRLIFETAPLEEIVAEFNRYNTHKLLIGDPELRQRQFGGSFIADQPETLVALLRQSYDLVVEERPGATVLRLPQSER